MKKIISILLISAIAIPAMAQKYMTRTGKISFFSSTPVENIEAFNNEVSSVLDAEKGSFVFQAPIKSFKFEKSLMQEHFNENYMESNKYPRADYKGKITGLDKVNFSKDGSYEVTTEGKLTIHGVTKEVKIPGTLVVKGDDITVKSVFNVKPKDYKINIPGIVEDKIADEIEVTVNCIMNKK